MGFFSRKKKTPPPKTTAPRFTVPTRLSYNIANLQGIGRREQQEDSFGFSNVTDVMKIREKGLLAIAADGMGGMQGGKLASDTAVACIRNEFEHFDYEASLCAQLASSVNLASETVFNMLGGMGGSTLVACIFYDDSLYWASVGDSYLFLLRGGKLYRLNRMHTVLNDEYLSSALRGDVTTFEGKEVSEAAALTKFLGMEYLENFDFTRRPMPVYSGDTFLLCSDGVGGVLSEECIFECMSRTDSNSVCEELEKNVIAENRQFQDNYTALVIKCEK